jgi:putative aldouronate transport system substrate-binding protein
MFKEEGAKVRKTIKSIAAILCLMLIFSVTACQTIRTSDTSKSTADATKDVKVDDTGSKEETATPEKEIVTLYCATKYGSFKKDTEKERNVHKAIMDATGVDLQMIDIPPDQYINKVNLLLSSNDNLDIIPELSLGVAREFYENNVLYKITDEDFQKYGSNVIKEFPDDMHTVKREDGNYMGVPAVFTAVPYAPILMIREEWANKLTGGLPNTIEEFEKYMQAVLENDPNGNGVKDEVPLVFNSLGYLEGTFIPAFTKYANHWRLGDDNKFCPPELDPGFVDYLAKMREWYEKGYIFADNFSAEVQQMRELVAQNKVGATASDWTSITVYSAWEVLVKSIPDSYYRPWILQGENGINQYPLRQRVFTCAAITAKCKYPQTALTLLNYNTTEEGFNTVTYGVENDNFKKNPDGTFEFLSEDSTDWRTADYYLYYLIIETF